MYGYSLGDAPIMRRPSRGSGSDFRRIELDNMSRYSPNPWPDYPNLVPLPQPGVEYEGGTLGYSPSYVPGGGTASIMPQPTTGLGEGGRRAQAVTAAHRAAQELARQMARRRNRGAYTYRRM